ncbi:hypothetical protein MTO96_051328 [Rhipicephalus appendiculatus]
MSSGRQRSIRVAAFLIAACALTTPLDPTDIMPAGYHVFRLGENAARNLMLLYDGVIQALASIELQRWIDACACTLLQGDMTLLLQSPAVLLGLGVLLKILSESGADAPPSCQQENVRVNPDRRYLTAFTDTEEDARLTLHRRNRCCPCRKQRDVELWNRRSPRVLKKLSDEVVAARVIQRWVRTKFQPWVAVRRSRRPPALAADWTDQDTGAVEVTMVDHDFMSAVEEPSQPPLVEVDMNEIGSAPDAPPVDDGVDGIGPPAGRPDSGEQRPCPLPAFCRSGTTVMCSSWRRYLRNSKRFQQLRQTSSSDPSRLWLLGLASNTRESRRDKQTENFYGVLRDLCIVLNYDSETNWKREIVV